MSKVVDVSKSGGDYVIRGKALVLPSSSNYGSGVPLNGSLRFNPTNNDVEICFGGVWAAIGGAGGGGPLSIADIVGLQAALNAKSPSVHAHSIAEVTGLQIALDGKSNTNHGHSLESIPNLVPTLTSLQTQINSKVGASHAHTIANVTGLQTALDQRALEGHVHNKGDIEGLDADLVKLKIEKVAFALPGSPPTGYTFSWIAGVTTLFSNDWQGSFASVDTPPASPYEIRVKQGSVTVGWIKVNTNGSIIFDTDYGTVMVEAGDKLTFVCPVKDTSLSNISITLVGARA